MEKPRLSSKSIVSFFGLALLFSLLYALPASAVSNVSGYTFDSHDVDIKVNQNNSFDISETIIADFDTPHHGIYMTLPLFNTLRRLDGTTTTNHARITNLSVSEDYTTEVENSNYVIKIGSADKTITGKHTYLVKYNYNIGRDPLNDKDELYFNIISDNWETPTDKVTFKITLPEAFDSSTLGFSSGLTGSVTNKVHYSIDNNTISGSYDGPLKAHEAITIRLELPEGYFVTPSPSNNPLVYILFFVIPSIFVGICFYLWFKFGRDDYVAAVVEYKPPKDLNSLDAGFLYKGRATSSDVTSLLIYLANQGYLKISEVEQKTFLGSTKKTFKITKLKNYTGKNTNERVFMDGLFALSKSEKAPLEVTPKDLENHFYTTVNSILSDINSKDNLNKIFEKSASSKSIFISLMILAVMAIIIILPIALYGTPDNFIADYFYAVMHDQICLFGVLYGFACIISMTIFKKLLPKLTKYGTEMLGKLRGLKDFLQTVEKDRIETMVEEDPKFFYNILPFAYVLGVSDKWIKKFESISMEPPSWYDGPDAFDMVMFGSFISSTMSSANSSMASSPNSSSSGGGFSGGGSGGSGGGAW